MICLFLLNFNYIIHLFLFFFVFWIFMPVKPKDTFKHVPLSMLHAFDKGTCFKVIFGQPIQRNHWPYHIQRNPAIYTHPSYIRTRPSTEAHGVLPRYSRCRVLDFGTTILVPGAIHVVNLELIFSSQSAGSTTQKLLLKLKLGWSSPLWLIGIHKNLIFLCLCVLYRFSRQRETVESWRRVFKWCRENKYTLFFIRNRFIRNLY